MRITIPLAALTVLLLVTSAAAQPKPDPQARINAIGERARTSSAAVIELAQVMLSDTEHAPRAYASSHLQNLGPKAAPAAPTLTKIVEDGRHPARTMAIDVLGAIGPGAKSALPVLKTALDDSDPFVNLCAARAVLAIDGDVKSAVPVLVDLLDPKLRVKDEDRRGAIATLVTLGAAAEPALPRIVEWMNGDNPHLSGDAERALIELGPAALPVIDTIAQRAAAKGPGSPHRNNAMLQALERMGTKAQKAAPAMVKIIEDSELRDLWPRTWRVLAAIGAPAKVAAPALLASMKNPRFQPTNDFVAALCAGGPDVRKEVEPVLIDWLLDKQKSFLHPQVAIGLGRIGGGKQAMIELLAEPDAKVLHPHLIAALSQMKAQDKAFIDALAAALKNPATAAGAADGLAEIGPPAKAALPALQAALKDAIPEGNKQRQYFAAARAILRMGPNPAVTAELKGLLSHKSLDVPVHAAAALLGAKVTDPRFDAALLDVIKEEKTEGSSVRLMQNPELWPSAIAVARASRTMTPALIRLAQTGPYRVRYKAIVMLGLIGDGAAANIAPLQAAKSDPHLRDIAAAAMTAIRAGDDVALRAAVQNEPTWLRTGTEPK